MSDIVKRLRAPVELERNDGMRIEAADEIERLRSANAALVEALVFARDELLQSDAIYHEIEDALKLAKGDKP